MIKWITYMNRTELFCSVIFLVFIFATFYGFHLLKKNTIKANDGIFYKKMADKMSLIYIVDTEAQLCFAKSNSHMIAIDCALLKNRSDWKNIITWID